MVLANPYAQGLPIHIVLYRCVSLQQKEDKVNSGGVDLLSDYDLGKWHTVSK